MNSTISQTTIRLPLFSSVKPVMFIGREYQQILDSIISFISVDVVDMLRSLQFSTKMFFHNKPMFKFLHSLTLRNQYISLDRLALTVLPHRVVFTTHSYSYRFVETLFTTVHIFRSDRLKFFLTNGTAFYRQFAPFRICHNSSFMFKSYCTRIRAAIFTSATISLSTLVTISGVVNWHKESLPYVYT